MTLARRKAKEGDDDDVGDVEFRGSGLSGRRTHHRAAYSPLSFDILSYSPITSIYRTVSIIIAPKSNRLQHNRDRSILVSLRLLARVGESSEREKSSHSMRSPRSPPICVHVPLFAGSESPCFNVNVQCRVLLAGRE